MECGKRLSVQPREAGADLEAERRPARCHPARVGAPAAGAANGGRSEGVSTENGARRQRRVYQQYDIAIGAL